MGEDMTDDDLAPARGIVTGIGLGLLVWCIIGLLAWIGGVWATFDLWRHIYG